MSPSPIFFHQHIQANLSFLLTSYVRKNKLGEVVTAPMDVTLSMTDIVQPDIIFISNERKEIIAKRIIGAPDLLVEILSETTETRDRTIKKSLYEKSGVLEYWLVDVDEKTIEQFVLKNKKYARKGIYSVGQKISSEAVKGFETKVEKVFE